MQFPSKIEDRLGYVSFSVAGGGGGGGAGSTPEGADPEAAKEALEQDVEDGTTSKEETQEATGGLAGFLGGLNDAVNAVGDAFQEVFDAFNGKGEDKETVKKAPPSFSEPGGDVTLYLPAGFQINEGVQYDGVDLGVAGAFAEQGKGIAEASAASGQSFLDQLKTDIGSPSARLAAIETARRAGLNAGAVAGAQAAAGVAVNPNQRVLFKRVNIREFRFAFTLIPINAGEAATVESIIKYFRHYLYPEPIGGDIKVGYKFPEKFNIKVGSSLGWNAPEIKPCYLRGVAITYNPNAMAFHEDGNPMETQISLDFQEAAALDRTDVPL